ncbi:DUF2177 family protein [Pelagibacterales bacterium]|jgi:uncharacterized membrane protein|nr:DUF2177 family protein [Pelagibacterales bacterium]MDA7763590.1 DUF2177 family protein [Pelagibacterales bacterium]MDA9137375.1 DUF2177 family protein [Pelagibacterales bacterium]MDA9980907.1 DUF2177 family protein [Pelagibacterales bacterium]MDB9818506.1 DUF2177 family protein [Pelagibacterales bacterium]|tara:strand:+ start:226 stop:615 length:390 start_codon:yes stop_codon:yes gene_type:complete
MIKAFLIATVYFIIIDITFINLVIVKIYKSNLPEFVEIGFKAVPAILFYLIFLSGLLYFSILPNKTYSISQALISGGMYGLTTYATYALTVFAVMNIFNWNIVVSDVMWGIFLSATVSVLTVITLSKIN